MRKTGKLQVVENTPNLGVDKNIQKVHSVVAMAKPRSKTRKFTKVAFVPNDAENAVIQAAISKFGLRKATDIIRMALRRLADAEGLNAS